MSEMIERVARAIYASDEFANEKPTWDEIAEFIPEANVHEMYRNMACAAIEAMREPTEEMKVAGTSKEYGPSPGYSLDAYDAEDVWRLMIDAALSTSKRGET